MSHSGLLSQITFSWMTGMMWKIYRQGVDHIQDLYVSDTERAQPNVARSVHIYDLRKCIV